MKKEWIYLAQTDTTVGFYSHDAGKLTKIKDRPDHKPFLIACNRLRLTHSIGRIPRRFRSVVRRSRKTSFILPNGRSFRIVGYPHAEVLELTGPCYTTSANPHGSAFDPDWAKKSADVIVETPEGLHEEKASRIWRLGRKKRKRVR